jgi:hypothetical protein
MNSLTGATAISRVNFIPDAGRSGERGIRGGLENFVDALKRICYTENAYASTAEMDFDLITDTFTSMSGW